MSIPRSLLSISVFSRLRVPLAFLIVFSLSLGLLVLPRHLTPFIPTAEAAAADLFFSEYVEGSSNNKALEIYNGTGSPVNLATGGYNVQMYFNGSSSAGLTINLTGTVAAGDVFVLAQSTASAAILAQADQTNASSWYNGDDAVVLRKGTIFIDVIGQIGFDPGTEWGTGNTSTADNTIQRKSTICSGDTNGSDAFDPSSEWNGFATDTFTGLGSHTSNCSNPSTNPSGVGSANPSSVAVGSSSLLTVNVTPGTNPASTGIAVAADLTPIGGSAAQQFYDDGTNGDPTSGDNVFSFNATVAAGTSGGAKSLPFVVSDVQGRSGNGTISVTIPAPTNPSGTGTADPDAVTDGGASLLTFIVTPGTNPTSTGITVTGDLSAIGGSAAQQFVDNGNNIFVYSATVAPGTTGGSKNLPITITDGQGRSGSGSITLNVYQPADHLVISQVYGGGGNTNATFQNDYVEIYNPTGSPVNTLGWSLQYSSAGGSTWTNKQPLGGIIGPGEYYLVSLASGGAVGAMLPDANISGEINMSGTAGKIALVKNGDSLAGGACPTGDPDLVDLVGYGTTANCSEGATKAPAPSNTTAIFRKGGGAIDTNVNGSDFTIGTPSPRRTTPIQEIGPLVLTTDPSTDGFNAPKDASIEVDFTEPVTVDAGWFDITCASGQHDSVTISSTNSGKVWVITPNVNFTPGEQCSVSVYKDKVHDVDTDDATPETDILPADYTWSFIVATGQPAPYTPDVHLTMGNPSDAVADVNQPGNYLMEKAGYVLSYNRDKGTPNWVSWHLDSSWYGTLSRDDTFRPDPAVPADWYRVQATDYFASGFDRGHMTPNADRDNENRIPINQETYLMSNMVPQAPDNNQGPWANLESYLRTITDAGNEIYIVSGPAGVGGTGSNGTVNTIADGHITVPAYTWKVALVLPKGDDDISRATASTRTIAVIMPNVQGIRTSNRDDWQNYLTSVDQVESLTGYNFFSNLPDPVENGIEAGVNGNNPPGTADQAIQTSEDTAVQFTLNAVNPTNNVLTVSVNSSPAGALSCSGINCTYTPPADFNGSDSFTYQVSNGISPSNSSTVAIAVLPVNDAPTASNDTGTQSVQYSDAIQTVTVTGADIDSTPLTSSVSYTKNSEPSQSGLPNGLSMSASNCTPSGSGASCTWTVSGRALVEPGTYTITFGVSDGSLPSVTTFTVTVTQEDARVDYTGALYASTSGTSSNSASVTLSATIRDITALCDTSVDPTCDQLDGDIANATVTFVNRDTNTVLASNVPLGYVTTGDTKTATATANVTLTTGTNEAAQYTIGIIVSGYYTRDSSSDDTVVTVSKPTPGVISGGGYLLLSNSGGLRAGDAGTKNNFGFNIKNEKNGPKGNINILVRRVESDGLLHTYQIKGNAMTSLSAQTAAGTATFNGKANIQDITDPLNVITVDGNASLQVVMTDASDQGGTDSVAITLWNKSGGLWFASNWNGAKTVEQTIGGGNLQVR